LKGFDATFNDTLPILFSALILTDLLFIVVSLTPLPSLLAPTRTTAALDHLADAAGVLVAFALACILFHWFTSSIRSLLKLAQALVKPIAACTERNQVRGDHIEFAAIFIISSSIRS